MKMSEKSGTVRSEVIIRKQEEAFSNAIDQFIEAGDYDTAIEMVRSGRGIGDRNLIALLKIASGNEHQKYYKEAYEIFVETFPEDITENQILNFLQACSTSARAPFLGAFEAYIKEYAAQRNFELRQLDRHSTNKEVPAAADIDTADEALEAMRIKGGKVDEYLKRYLELDGDSTNEIYLKIRYNNATIYHPDDTDEIASAVEALSKNLTPRGYRGWFRRRLKPKGLSIPAVCISKAFEQYILVEPETLTVEDWSVLAQTALQYNDASLGVVVFTALSNAKRTVSSQPIYEQLVNKFGFRTESHSGSYSNPVYDGRRAVNMAAFRVADGWKYKEAED